MSRTPSLRHSAERDPEALERHRRDPDGAVGSGGGRRARSSPRATGHVPVADLGPASAFRPTRSRFSSAPWTIAPSSPRSAATEAADLFRDDPAFIVSRPAHHRHVRASFPKRNLASWRWRNPCWTGMRATASAPIAARRTIVAHAGFRRDCPACETQHFPRTDPVVIMLVTRGETVPARPPGAGFRTRTYSCLAGFLEPGETVEDAVSRETFEEAGVRVGAVRYLAVPALAVSLLADDRLRRARPRPTKSSSTGRSSRMCAGSPATTSGRCSMERIPEFAAPSPIAIAHHLLRRWMKS